MRICRTLSELDHPTGTTSGFVPTMGALHEGHLSLIRASKAENDQTIVSIFVNPTQFGRGEDFEKYPRDLDRDAALAESAGADIIFAPDASEVYPRQTSTIHVPVVTERWEGAARPGHFDGVATVVAKLFNMVQPTVSYFGLKDLQQCMVIERMVEDLNMPYRLSFQETIRESDGLAMSSRNVYLDAEQRQTAPALYEALIRLASNSSAGESIADPIRDEVDGLRRKGFDVDYLALVDLPDMVPIDAASSRCALIVAAKLGTTRLIDNLLISV